MNYKVYVNYLITVIFFHNYCIAHNLDYVRGAFPIPSCVLKEPIPYLPTTIYSSMMVHGKPMALRIMEMVHKKLLCI